MREHNGRFLEASRQEHKDKTQQKEAKQSHPKFIIQRTLRVCVEDIHHLFIKKSLAIKLDNYAGTNNLVKITSKTEFRCD